MRIWIVNHYADPPDGLATRSYDIARRFGESGHPTSIFVSNFSHYRFRPMRRLRPLHLWQEEDIAGVRLIWLRTSPYRRNDWWRVINMVSFTVLALVAGTIRRERPDVVIGVSVHPLGALAGFFLARIKRARFFFEETDLWPQTLIDFGRLRPDSLSARGMRWLERFLYRKAERIVMFMRHTEEYVRSQQASPEKILWVPHGVELSRYRELQPYAGAPDRPFRVMFLGGFLRSNSIETILDAARILKSRGRDDVRFFLVGSGAEREDLMSHARTLGLENVEFPPAVPKSEIARVMSRADAFIYGLRDLPLYRYGPTLNKVTDYLAGARPIIFFGNSTYNPVKEAEAGFSVPPEDPVAVADAIERLVALTPEQRVVMGRNGRRFVEEHHNIPKLAQRLLAAMAAEPA